MDRDRDLLFGVLAVQLRRVSPAQLVEAAAAWAADPELDLGSRLVEAGVLSSSDHELIGRLVDGAIAGYQGDAAATLDALGGDAEMTRSFCGSIARTPSGGVRFSVAQTIDSSGDAKALTTSRPAVEETPGRYTGASERGRGGIGRVLLVHDQVLGRDVALKELLPGPGSGHGDSPEWCQAHGHSVLMGMEVLGPCREPRGCFLTGRCTTTTTGWRGARRQPSRSRPSTTL